MNYQEHRLLLLKLTDEALRYKFGLPLSEIWIDKSKPIEIKTNSEDK